MNDNLKVTRILISLCDNDGPIRTIDLKIPELFQANVKTYEKVFANAITEYIESNNVAVKH